MHKYFVNKKAIATFVALLPNDIFIKGRIPLYLVVQSLAATALLGRRDSPFFISTVFITNFMTSFNLKNVKLFSTEQEKEDMEKKQHEKDSSFGDPKSELAVMHNASRWGIHFIACVTLLSTMAFIYRVTFPHVTDLIGETAAAISMLTLSFGIALAIEIMLRGNWEPFFKKLFVKAEVDMVLLFLGILFTGVVVAGAFTGMEIISDEGAKAPEIESISASSASMSSMIETNKAEIATLNAGKGKGVYAYQGKPTPHAKNRVKELEAQNTAAFNSITSLSNTTEKANAAKIETFTAKQAKAVRFLSRLAIGCEILKFVIFIFWGYRSYELKNFDPKPSTPQQPVSPPTPQKPITPKMDTANDLQIHSIAKIAIQNLQNRLKTATEQNDNASKNAALQGLQTYTGMGYDINSGEYIGIKTTPLLQTPQAGAKTDNSAKDVWKVKTNNRRSYKKKFQEHFTNGRFKYEVLVKAWEANEDALFEACTELGFQYEEIEMPKKEDFITVS